MMSISRLAAALVLGFCSAAAAQENVATIQLQYREQIPENGDLKPLRTKILAQAERDCEAAAKAIGRRCNITHISFNTNRSYGDQYGRVFSASVGAAFVGEGAKPE